MRLVIDSERCTGHARCVSLTPELFTDDENGYGIVLGSGDIDAALMNAAQRAVGACPERAILLLE